MTPELLKQIEARDADATTLYVSGVNTAKILQLACDDRRALLAYCRELEAALVAAKIPHTVCEDGWYSCPLSDEGCLDGCETECTCGAQKHNAAIDSALACSPPSVVVGPLNPIAVGVFTKLALAQQLAQACKERDEANKSYLALSNDYMAYVNAVGLLKVDLTAAKADLTACQSASEALRAEAAIWKAWAALTITTDEACKAFDDYLRDYKRAADAKGDLNRGTHHD